MDGRFIGAWLRKNIAAKAAVNDVKREIFSGNMEKVMVHARNTIKKPFVFKGDLDGREKNIVDEGKEVGDVNTSGKREIPVLGNAKIGEYGVTPQTSSSLVVLNPDVVIYGGGLSGAAAAIQLGRLGRSVVLIEPTHWLGGQASAAGVSQFDMHAWSRRFGLFREILESISSTYSDSTIPYKVGCHAKVITDLDYASFCPEPENVHQGLMRLMPPNNVHILFDTEVYSLVKTVNGSNVIVHGVYAKNIYSGIRYRINAQITIDASEYGDLIPMLGVPFYAGYIEGIGDGLFSSRQEMNNSAACIDAITYTAVIRDKTNAPSNIDYSQKVPRPNDYTVQDSLHFLNYIVPYGQTSQDGIPFNDPDSGLAPYRWSFRLETRYRSFVDKYNTNFDMRYPTKTSLNHVNDLKTDAKTGMPLTVRYLADLGYRKQIDCQAKMKTYKYIYYLTHIYKAILNGNNILFNYGPTQIPWVLSKEEGFCSGPTNCYSLVTNNCPDIPDDVEQYMATIPYVREGYRIYGMKISGAVDNGADDLVGGLLRWQTVQKVDGSPYGQPRIAKHTMISGIAVAGYAFDRHACTATNDPNSPFSSAYVNTPAWRSGYFQIPLGAFVPAGVKGFLVAEKNLAVDHFVQGAIRVHDAVVFSGQSVAFIADHLIDSGLDPTKLRLPKIQEDVVSSGAKTARFVFKDIDYETQRKYWKYAELMNTWGILNGNNGYFMPDVNSNREYTSIILTRVAQRLQIPLVTTHNNYFSDVPASSYARRYINQMFVNGITNGCYYNPNTGERRFCPSSPTKAWHLIVFLYRLSLKAPAGALRREPEVNSCNVFVLPADTPPYAAKDVRDAIESGVFSIQNTNGVCRLKVLLQESQLLGCDYDGICLTRNLTRIQASVIVWDFILTTFNKHLKE